MFFKVVGIAVVGTIAIFAMAKICGFAEQKSKEAKEEGRKGAYGFWTAIVVVLCLVALGIAGAGFSD